MEIEIDERDQEKLHEESYDDLLEIPRVSCDELTYNQFYHRFMKKNLPVVIKGIKINTETSSKWFEKDKLNLDPLLSVLGKSNVPVANCSRKYFDSHEKVNMKFSEYVEYWNGDRKSAGELYLKDFHLKQEFPLLDFYNVPFYFASDWLNEFAIDNRKDDYRFIYIGPKDTWTPFHSDVFGSFSWSANIYGRKQWLLLPPGEETKLRDVLGNLPFKINKDLLEEQGVKHFDFIQSCNETLFVPSKWFHQVFNLEDTVSVNHNWFNGCNMRSIIENMGVENKNIEKEISDCKNMENYDEHCQLMLKSLFGMNYRDIIEILAHIVDKRLKSGDFKMFGKVSLGKMHKRRDLEIILEIYQELERNVVVAKTHELSESVKDNVKKIKECLK